MTTKYESMGFVLSHVERSAILMALDGGRRASLADLAETGNATLASIGKDPPTPETYKSHVEKLRGAGILYANEDSGTFLLTDKGKRVLNDLLGR